MAKTWKVVRSEKDDKGNTIELRYASFGKGKARVEYWRIYRNNEYAGYGSIESDAHVNFERVLAGATHNPVTGRYEA